MNRAPRGAPSYDSPRNARLREKEPMTNKFKAGMLVQHASLGQGKVVAAEPSALHVFFAGSGSRSATKLRLPMALPMLAPTDGDAAGWSAGLWAFALDPKTGRYSLGETWLSHDDAVARFLGASEHGFTSSGESGERNDRAAKWRRANEAFVELLGAGEGERLLADGDVDELVRRAVKIERNVRVLQSVAEKAVLQEVLGDRAVARRFFAELFALLAESAPAQARFEALASTVAAVPGGTHEAGWAAVTTLPFVAQPDRHVVLRPRLTCEAAHRLGLELRYTAQPSWPCYAALLRSAGQLLEKLRPLGARDFIDVESFLHVVTAKRAHAKAS